MDKSGNADPTANTVRLKGVPAPSSKFPAGQLPKLVVSKSPGDERAVAVKAQALSKSGAHSKNPTNSVKQQATTNRASIQAKREKPRPGTPLRDGKSGTVGTASVFFKNQAASGQAGAKLDKQLSKSSIDPQMKSSHITNVDANKRLPNRPSSANRSPRAATPPQARHPSQGVSGHTKLDRPIQGKRSPGHAGGENMLCKVCTCCECIFGN